MGDIVSKISRYGNPPFFDAPSADALLGKLHVEKKPAAVEIPDYPWDAPPGSYTIGRNLHKIPDYKKLVLSKLFRNGGNYGVTTLVDVSKTLDDLMEAHKDTKVTRQELTVLLYAGCNYVTRTYNRARSREEEEIGEELEERAEKALASGDKTALTEIVTEVMISESRGFGRSRNNPKPSLEKTIIDYVTRIVTYEKGKHIKIAVRRVLANVLLAFVRNHFTRSLEMPSLGYGAILNDTPVDYMFDAVDTLDKQHNILGRPLDVIMFVTLINGSTLARLQSGLTVVNAAIPEATRCGVILDYVFAVLY